MPSAIWSSPLDLTYFWHLLLFPVGFRKSPLALLSNLTMKLLLLLSLALATNGFSHSSMAYKATPTALQAASGLGSRPKFGQVSTEPVATRKVSQRERNAMKDVVLDPDYSLTWSFAALCPLIIAYHPCKYSSFLGISTFLLFLNTFESL